jgi:uncharacterized protein YjbJ (UPF0337 family)
MSATQQTSNGFVAWRQNIMNKDQVNGRINEAQGLAKEVTGKFLRNKRLEAKGKAQRAAGKVKAGYGDLKADVKEGS